MEMLKAETETARNDLHGAKWSTITYDSVVGLMNTFFRHPFAACIVQAAA